MVIFFFICILRYIISHLGAYFNKLRTVISSGKLSPLPYIEVLSLAIWGGGSGLNMEKLKFRKIAYPRTYTTS